MSVGKYIATLVYAGASLFAILAITSIAANFLGGDSRVTGAALGAFANQLTAAFVVFALGAGLFFILRRQKKATEENKSS